MGADPRQPEVDVSSRRIKTNIGQICYKIVVSDCSLFSLSSRNCFLSVPIITYSNGGATELPKDEADTLSLDFVLSVSFVSSPCGV